MLSSKALVNIYPGLEYSLIIRKPKTFSEIYRLHQKKVKSNKEEIDIGRDFPIDVTQLLPNTSYKTAENSLVFGGVYFRYFKKQRIMARKKLRDQDRLRQEKKNFLEKKVLAYEKVLEETNRNIEYLEVSPEQAKAQRRRDRAEARAREAAKEVARVAEKEKAESTAKNKPQEEKEKDKK